MSLKKFGLILFFLIFFVSITFSLTINCPSSFSLCQCETETPVYSVCASTTGTYNISISGLGAKWVKVAPTSMSLLAGTCKDLFVFVTPECYANSGTFPFQINVIGGNIFFSGREIK